MSPDALATLLLREGILPQARVEEAQERQAQRLAARSAKALPARSRRAQA